MEYLFVIIILLPGPLWAEVVVPVKVLSMCQIELLNHLLRIIIIIIIISYLKYRYVQIIFIT